MQHNELMQAFIFRDLPSDDSKRNFNQRMQNFLQRIPNHFGRYTRNFFNGLFMGALYHFEYTENKKQIEEKQGRIRSFYYYDQAESTYSVMHIVFVVNDRLSYLRSLVFSNDAKLPAVTNEVKSKILVSNILRNFRFSQKSVAAIYYQNQEGFIWEEQPRVTREQLLSSDAITTLIQNLVQLEFVEISQSSELSSISVNEAQVKEFGSSQVGEVKKALKNYLTSSKKIYQQALPNFEVRFGKKQVSKEAFSAGFMYGGLAANHYLYI